MEIKSRRDLAKYFNKLGFKIGAEVGVAGGHYSEALCQEIPGLRLYCIDPWIKYEDNRRGGDQNQQSANFELTKEKLKDYNVQLVRAYSMEAISQFKDGELDFVFIDGNHDFDYVLEDIINWTRKVRVGGIVAGHDFYHFHNSGVIEAVYAYTQFHKLGLNVIGENKKGRTDEAHPCWWFVKK